MSKKNGLADPTRLKPFDVDDKQLLRVVIETPKGSRNKFAFDPDQHVFELKKVLPLRVAIVLVVSRDWLQKTQRLPLRMGHDSDEQPVCLRSFKPSLFLIARIGILRPNRSCRQGLRQRER